MLSVHQRQPKNKLWTQNTDGSNYQKYYLAAVWQSYSPRCISNSKSHSFPLNKKCCCHSIFVKLCTEHIKASTHKLTMNKLPTTYRILRFMDPNLQQAIACLCVYVCMIGQHTSQYVLISTNLSKL